MAGPIGLAGVVVWALRVRSYLGRNA
jgi:hypothetical protein